MNTYKQLVLGLVSAAGLMAGSAHADAVFEFNYGVGGGTLVSDDSGNTIHAGDGYGIAFGPHIPFNARDSWGLEITAAYREFRKRLTYAGVNYDTTWRVVPISAVLLVKTGFDMTLGAGATFHRQPKLIDERGTVPDLVFDNAVGAVGQIGMNNDGSLFGLRYTVIDYKQAGGVKKSGNQLALYLGAQF